MRTDWVREHFNAQNRTVDLGQVQVLIKKQKKWRGWLWALWGMLEFAQFCMGERRPIVRSFLPVSAARWTNRFPRGLGWERSLPLYGATELSKLVSAASRRTTDLCMILLQLPYVVYLIVSIEKIFLNECLPSKQHFYLNALKSIQYCTGYWILEL